MTTEPANDRTAQPPIKITTEARVMRRVIEILDRAGMTGRASGVLRAVSELTDLVINEKNSAYAEGKSMAEYDKDMNAINEATDLVHEAWVSAIAAACERGAITDSDAALIRQRVVG